MSYIDFVKKYSKLKNKKIIIFRSSILPGNIAGLFLNFFTNKEQSKVGQCMLDSFKNKWL